MRQLAVAVLFLILATTFASECYANYGYHYNKQGTGYWRDDSNDGNPYNNANALGMND